MSTIVTRAGKGAALTWTEGDANITNLNNDKIESLFEDSSPQLGGDLDVNGHQIVSSSNGNINIVPNGSGNINITPATGKIVLGATDWPAGPGSAGQVLTTSGGTGVLTWETPASGGATTLDGLNDVVITAAATGDILVYDGTNWVDTASSSIGVSNATTAGVASTVTVIADNTTAATNYPLFANAVSGNEELRSDSAFTYNPSTGRLTAEAVTVGSVNGTITVGGSSTGTVTTGNGTLTLHTNLGSTSGSIVINPNANANITLTPNGTGKVLTTQINYSEKQNDLGTSTWAAGMALLASNGNVQTTTVNAATFTLNALSGLISGGNSVTLFIIGGTTAPTSITQGTGTWKWAGGSKALSGVTGTTDVLSIYYNSANATHYASISKGFV